eukprot:26660-Eustigmatos_ZCMA.PRE.1
MRLFTHRGVGQRADRAVGVAQRGNEVVVAPPGFAARVHGRGLHVNHRVLTHERVEQVVDVAGFAEVATTAFGAVDPVVRRDEARVHAVVHQDRRGAALKHALHGLGRRRKAAVVAHHEQGSVGLLGVEALDV